MIKIAWFLSAEVQEKSQNKSDAVGVIRNSFMGV